MPKEKQSPSEYFVAGGFAGVISRTCIAPIERVKILYQVQRGTAAAGSSGLELAQNIWKHEGVLAFWKGNTAGVIRVMPCTGRTARTNALATSPRTHACFSFPGRYVSHLPLVRAL